MVIETNQEKETYALGVQMGQSAKPGAVYTLVGDLGVGKTVFTQGFAAGLGIDEPVNSPTFTIVQIYEEGRLPFYHFDVYRIGDVEEMDEIGYEDYIYGEGVSLIEWANQRLRLKKIWKKGLIIGGLAYANISVRQLRACSQRGDCGRSGWKGRCSDHRRVHDEL